MHDIDLTDEMHIERDWKKSLALAALCLLLMAFFLYGVLLDPEDVDDVELRAVSWILLPAFTGLFVFVVYGLFVPRGAPVRLSPEEFLDARAGQKPIPWSEVRNIARRGEYIFLTLRLGYARGYPFTLVQRLLKSTRKRAGPSHVLVADWCLSADQGRLLELITAYWKRYGPG